jgi:hypothetical protein
MKRRLSLDINLIKNIFGSFVILQDGNVVYISGDNEGINNIETIYFQYEGK